jgi:DNA-binding beta-propeller fold protein YncE
MAPSIPREANLTGGNGSGAGLGSGHSLVVSADGDEVVAVNAGSNSISAFAVHGNRLELIGSPVPSGGTRPTSVTINDDLVYVMNAGSNSIAGFHLGGRGSTPIQGSIQPLGSTSRRSPRAVVDRSVSTWIFWATCCSRMLHLRRA